MSLLPDPLQRTACDWEIVQGLELNDFLTEKITATVDELTMEKSVVADLLG